MAKNRLVREEDTRRRAEAVLVVQVLGAVLLLPALVNLFTTRTLLFGVPLEVLYLFMVWLLLIGCAVIISSKMPRAPDSAQAEEGAPILEGRAREDGE